MAYHRIHNSAHCPTKSIHSQGSLSSSSLTFTTSTASASLVLEGLTTGASGAGAIGSARADLTARTSSLGLGGTRGTVSSFAAGAWAVGTAAGIAALAIVAAGA